jgi:hypothetical protein
LLKLAADTGVQLLMPLLGQPAEPAQADIVEPWWRAVDNSEVKLAASQEGEVTWPTSAPWPLD